MNLPDEVVDDVASGCVVPRDRCKASNGCLTSAATSWPS
jgi:hypothetical protein